MMKVRGMAFVIASEAKQSMVHDPQKKKLRKTGASCFHSSTPRLVYAKAGSLDALGLAARFARLADQTLKWLKGLPGKSVVEFADPL
jgi:hypothetical protein